VVGLRTRVGSFLGPSSRLTRRISTSGKAVSTEILLTRRWLPSSKNYNSFSEVSFNKRFSETAVRWQPQFPQS